MGLFDDIGDVVHSIGDELQKAEETVEKTVKEGAKVVGNAIESGVDWVEDTAEEAYDVTSKGLSKGVDVVEDTAEKAFEGAKHVAEQGEKVVEQAYDSAKDATGVVTGAYDFIKDRYEDAVEGFTLGEYALIIGIGAFIVYMTTSGGRDTVKQVGKTAAATAATALI